MPTVRIQGWPTNGAPFVPPASLGTLLSDAADMDATQLKAAFARLKKGKPVDIPFDPGDEEPARGMMKRLEALGLEAELLPESPSTEEDGRPRDWRLKGAVYVALFLIGAMVRGPWLGVLLVAVGLGAAGCAALLRRMTRRAERRFEVPRSFDPDDTIN